MKRFDFRVKPHGDNFFFPPQTEISKRLSALINQLVPFLSQEHQQQVLTAVERAKQITMSELNAVIGVSSLNLTLPPLNEPHSFDKSLRLSSNNAICREYSNRCMHSSFRVALFQPYPSRCLTQAWEADRVNWQLSQTVAIMDPRQARNKPWQCSQSRSSCSTVVLKTSKAHSDPTKTADT
jgi:Groucho/TLE N-terminal Q-rich domain